MNSIGGGESEYIDAILSGQIDFRVEVTSSLFKTRGEHDTVTDTWSWRQANSGLDSVSAGCQPCGLEKIT